MIHIDILLGIGMLFQILGSLALHRFPDVYTRLHGATKCSTFGSIFIYLGVIAYGITLPDSGLILGVHTMLVMLLILLTNPTGAHAIARSAYRSGVMPKQAVVDKIKEDGI
ncbi:MAG: cation:proton antiporter [Candidatus Altiarchaeales archaeon ex4484_2]|nr:MAG: cation:proton antiporter [Candidatus Altiarchaeales archaeon ex4484_2]